jgi:hypothetical protein
MQLGKSLVAVLWLNARMWLGESLLDEIISWLGSFAIIIGFFWLQLQIDQLNKGWGHTALFLLTLIGEVYLIWLWNSKRV